MSRDFNAINPKRSKIQIVDVILLVAAYFLFPMLVAGIQGTLYGKCSKNIITEMFIGYRWTCHSMYKQAFLRGDGTRAVRLYRDYLDCKEVCYPPHEDCKELTGFVLRTDSASTVLHNTCEEICRTECREIDNE